MYADDEDLTVFYRAVAVLQVDLALTDTLYFGTGETDAALVFFFYEIVVESLAVVSDYLYSFNNCHIVIKTTTGPH